MKKEVFVTDKAPAPVGPYSQAIAWNQMLFCSGQIPLDAKTGEVFTGDIKEQTRIAMNNAGEVLKAAGLNFDNVVKTTIFITSMNDFSMVNEVYSTYFKELPPARSCVEVSALPKGVNVEVEFIAAKA
ncbi:MAG: RidA family protein [Bdellovibrionaceae bacterium]|nr:RidA family protein [Pseudobdellovibrionaceae bacterium]MCB9092889.1 RidA family protein [Halobacteriovoraceae bacterium]